jgi:hypothetical protein
MTGKAPAVFRARRIRSVCAVRRRPGPAARLPEQSLSGRCQPQAATVAHEQAPGQRFKSCDLLADRALRQMHRGAGGRHAGVIGNRDESAEQRDVEISCHSSITGTNGWNKKFSLS